MRELHRSSQVVLAFAIGVGLLSALRYLVGAGALLVAALLAILGVLALTWSGWRAVSFRTAETTNYFVVAATVWLAWVFAPLDTAGVYVKFWLERPSYDSAAREAARGVQPPCATTKACMFEAGSDANLAFPWEGIIDNWIGVVHDPSGRIEDVDSHKGAFGGDLVGCQHLSGPYYLCSFT
ncbi:hypothetical protein PFX98_11280 [Paucibacter sediminis]|uniref:Uncharacterized protein n=1 Tax=Paucibacter sediminis TaxID=3019553 RepID=A0AA95NIY3_9BURK|nr:hypothetical protein [Paucibacter sp. S2-9]WIT14177.1 hypothetical protein PFX98_11280 [Paucibacter sp. S2-9]